MTFISWNTPVSARKTLSHGVPNFNRRIYADICAQSRLQRLEREDTTFLLSGQNHCLTCAMLLYWFVLTCAVSLSWIGLICTVMLDYHWIRKQKPNDHQLFQSCLWSSLPGNHIATGKESNYTTYKTLRKWYSGLCNVHEQYWKHGGSWTKRNSDETRKTKQIT